MILSQLRTTFELLTDDKTELSTAEENIILNKGANRLYAEKEWEFLRTNTTLIADVNGQLTLPTDFMDFMKNFNAYGGSPTQVVLWQNSIPIPVVPLGIAQQYKRNFFTNAIVPFGDTLIALGSQAAYMEGGLVKFTYPVTSGTTFNFDYQKQPVDLILDADTPSFPARFHYGIIYSALMDDDLIQRTEKSRSNLQDNQALYQKYLSDMKMWDAKNFFL